MSTYAPTEQEAQKPVAGPSNEPTATSSELKPPQGPTRTVSRSKTTGKFLKSFAKTAVGMHPLWLMGEAVTGKKVGSQFKAGQQELLEQAGAMRELLATSTDDVIIIVNEKLRSTSSDTSKTADVIKKAGDDAIVVVTTSIEKAQDQLKLNSPAIKHAILKNGKEVIIVVDKALKHPMVITGVHKFAKSKGIPRPEAVLTVASFALSKILAAMPTDQELEALLHDGLLEVDAEELHRTSTKEAEAEASRVGEQVEEGSKAKGKKKDSCTIM